MADSDEIVKELESLGLGKTEARLYLAGLSFPQSVSVPELQKQTDLKRPTIYHNLNLLMSRGLVSKVESLNKTLYIFSPPAQLERNVEAEVRDAKAKMKTLARLSKQLEELQPNIGQVSVRHFEGIQGIKTVVDMALFCKTPKWQVIAPADNFFSQFDERYASYYLITRKRHGIKSKTLWEKPIGGGRPLSKEELIERNPRYLPKSMQGQFSTTTIIFDNKVAIITSMKELSAVLVESSELSSLFSAMFEGLWEVSTKIDS